MATFVNDTFTDTAGTALTSHTGEAGATWAAGSPAPTGIVITAAGRVRNGTVTGYVYASGAPASAEYDVQADFYVASELVDTSICGRLSTGAETGYRLMWSSTLPGWELRKLVAGVTTSLGTYADTPTAGASRTAKLEIRDATKKAFIDGIERISSTDNAITAAGNAGIRMNQLVTPDDTKAIHLDNFQASDPVVAGADRLPSGIFVPRLRPKPLHIH